MSVDADVRVKCDTCASDADKAYCDRCLEAKLEREHEGALIGHVCDGETIDAAPDRIRDWLDREKIKPAQSLSAETLEAFGRCIEDLESQHG